LKGEGLLIMKKKIVSMMLCLAMVASLFAGCSNSPKQEEGGAKVTEAAPETTKTPEATQAGGEGSKELTKLSVFINMSWYPIDSFTGKIPEAIKKATGVDLDVTIATDNTQLGVMIASGELPDLVFTDTNVNELSNSDVCYALSDLTTDTGVDFTKSENYEERNKIAQSFSEDGKAYTLLNNYNTQKDWANLKIGAPGQACMYYRKDLLDAAGIALPTSMEEFTDCLAKVKKAYPNMTPLGLGGYWKLQTMSTWTGVSSEQYDPSTGAFKYEASTPSYKDFLSYSNKLYRAGYMTAEDYANENEADGHQRAYNDGCVFYPWYLAQSNLAQLQNNATTKTAEWAVLAPLGKAPVSISKGWAGAFISKNCSNTKAAATLVAYLNSVDGSRQSMWGVEGDDYTLGDDGVPKFSENYLAARNDSEKYYKEYNTMFYFGTSSITEIYMNYAGMDADKLSQFTAYSKDFKNYPEVGIAQPSTTSDEGVIKTKLDEFKKTFEAKVIFTDTDKAFESAYNEYMNALKDTGVDKYNDYMTKRIAEVKSEYGFTD
jgi:ABC-type sugar transport system, periplasmic component